MWLGSCDQIVNIVDGFAAEKAFHAPCHLADRIATWSRSLWTGPSAKKKKAQELGDQFHTSIVPIIPGRRSGCPNILSVADSTAPVTHNFFVPQTAGSLHQLRFGMRIDPKLDGFTRFCSLRFCLDFFSCEDPISEFNRIMHRLRTIISREALRPIHSSLNR